MIDAPCEKFPPRSLIQWPVRWSVLNWIPTVLVRYSFLLVYCSTSVLLIVTRCKRNLWSYAFAFGFSRLGWSILLEIRFFIIVANFLGYWNVSSSATSFLMVFLLVTRKQFRNIDYKTFLTNLMKGPYQLNNLQVDSVVWSDLIWPRIRQQKIRQFKNLIWQKFRWSHITFALYGSTSTAHFSDWNII